MEINMDEDEYLRAIVSASDDDDISKYSVYTSRNFKKIEKKIKSNFL